MKKQTSNTPASSVSQADSPSMPFSMVNPPLNRMVPTIWSAPLPSEALLGVGGPMGEISLTGSTKTTRNRHIGVTSIG